MITEDYCSFEVSKLLKEKGFEEVCMYFYDWDDEDKIYCICSNGGSCNEARFTNYYSMPTLQMAMKWLREVHKIFIEISVSIDLNGDYHYSYSILNRECKYVRKGYTDFDWNYEQACEVALKFCLEHLI